MSEQLYTVRTERGALVIEGPGIVWVLPCECSEPQAQSIARALCDCAEFHERRGEESAQPLECQTEGCDESATCGTPTRAGYKHLCAHHYREEVSRAD